MRLPNVSTAVAAAVVAIPVGLAVVPAPGQDFSITNRVEPVNGTRRDLLRQLQAWWDVHGYYPRHASQNDEGGTVKLHLVIYPDGRIWSAEIVDGSGSASLDTAAVTTFRTGFVRPFPPGTPNAELDLSLHYVLTHRHDQPAAVYVARCQAERENRRRGGRCAAGAQKFAAGAVVEALRYGVHASRGSAGTAGTGRSRAAVRGYS